MVRFQRKFKNPNPIFTFSDKKTSFRIESVSNTQQYSSLCELSLQFYNDINREFMVGIYSGNQSVFSTKLNAIEWRYRQEKQKTL